MPSFVPECPFGRTGELPGSFTALDLFYICRRDIFFDPRQKLSISARGASNGLAFALGMAIRRLSVGDEIFASSENAVQLKAGPGNWMNQRGYDENQSSLRDFRAVIPVRGNVGFCESRSARLCPTASMSDLLFPVIGSPHSRNAQRKLLDEPGESAQATHKD